MIIVKPLIIYVMMVKKHELVAWTTNIADNENGRLYLAPSIEAEIRQALIDDLGAIHREEYSTQGVISTSLARRMLDIYFELLR